MREPTYFVLAALRAEAQRMAEAAQIVIEPEARAGRLARKPRPA
jgi:hypothetical protein